MRMMNVIFESMKCKCIIIYLDNIIIHSCTLAEHIVHAREVLTLLTEPGLKAKQAKCSWACQKGNCCSIHIDNDGIHAQRYKTCVVMDWPHPENSKDVRGFLGLTSYYTKFIKYNTHIAMLLYTIATPQQGQQDVGQQSGELWRVMRTPFGWDRECQHAFNTLKKGHSNIPVVAVPDPKAYYCLHIDASIQLLVRVPSQVQDNDANVLGYFSCKSHNPKTRYPAYRTEPFGIREALLYRIFNRHRPKQPFVVHMDHAILCWILTQPHLAVQQMDILMVLLNVDWKVEHMLGVTNLVRDGSSRCLDFCCEQPNSMALEVTAAGEWIYDIKAGIVDHGWFRCIAHSFANPSPCPPPSTASTKECILLVPAPWLHLEENHLLWLRGDLEKKQVEKTARAKKMDKEEGQRRRTKKKRCR